jgi:hypothetical protein
MMSHPADTVTPHCVPHGSVAGVQQVPASTWQVPPEGQFPAVVPQGICSPHETAKPHSWPGAQVLLCMHPPLSQLPQLCVTPHGSVAMPQRLPHVKSALLQAQVFWLGLQNQPAWVGQLNVQLHACPHMSTP